MRAVCQFYIEGEFKFRSMETVVPRIGETVKLGNTTYYVTEVGYEYTLDLPGTLAAVKIYLK